MSIQKQLTNIAHADSAIESGVESTVSSMLDTIDAEVNTNTTNECICGTAKRLSLLEKRVNSMFDIIMSMRTDYATKLNLASLSNCVDDLQSEMGSKVNKVDVRITRMGLLLNAQITELENTVLKHERTINDMQN